MINDLIIRVEFENNIYDLEVNSSIPLRLDMSAVESQELGKFFGIGSQNFNIPGTKISNLFFNHAYDVSVDDIPAMYNTLPCSVILNGETVLIGTLHLFEVIASEDGYISYTVEVVDKVVQLNQSLGNKLLKDGDWSPYNHTLSSGSILDSWNDNLLSGNVFYPLADYGRDNEDSYPIMPRLQEGSDIGAIGNSSYPLLSKQFLPAIKARSVLDVIFKQVGFSYTGSFTDSVDFNNMYILPKAKDALGVVVPENATADFSATNTANQAVNGTVPFLVGLNQELLDPGNNFNPGTGIYTIPTTGEYTFQGQIGFFNPIQNVWADVIKIKLFLTIETGGSPIILDTAEILMDQSSGIGPFYLNVSYSDSFAPGVQLSLRGEVQRISGSNFIMTTLLQTAQQFRAVNTPVNFEGVTVDMGLQFDSQTKSIDILKGLIQQFNLVMIPSSDGSSVIQIEQFDEWMRAGEVKDWTYRYDTAKRKAISHTVDDLEREIFLKNADDNDRFSKLAIDSVPNDQYGTLRLLSDSNVPQGSVVIGDFFGPVILGAPLIYNATGSAGGYTFNLDLNSNMIIPHLYKLETGAQKSFVFKPRIGYKVTNNMTSGSVGYIGEGATNTEFSSTYSTISNLSSLPAIEGSTNDLHFNNTYTLFTAAGLNMNSGLNSYRKYWKTYLDSIYWEGSKKVKLDLYFEPFEYKQIKLNDKVIIKNQVFRINKISGFNISYPDVVSVELIKLYPEYWQLS